MTGPTTGADATTQTLRNQILLGTYAASERLPGERELSSALGISRLTLRSALTRLEAEGLVRTMPGSGTRVLDYRESAGLELLGHLADLVLSGASMPAGPELFASLLELRRAVAVDAIGLATERASDDELRALRLHLAEQRTLLHDPQRFMAHEIGFMRLIARASKNLAFELLLNAVMRTFEGHAGIEQVLLANAGTTRKVAMRLVEDMETRDVKRARLSAAKLLERLDQATLGALSALLPRRSVNAKSVKAKAAKAKATPAAKETQGKAKPTKAAKAKPVKAKARSRKVTKTNATKTNATKTNATKTNAKR